MAMTSAEKQAARRERLKGLQVTVTLTPEAKAALDSLMAQGLTQSQAISEALGNFDILPDLKDGGGCQHAYNCWQSRIQALALRAFS